MAEADSGPGQDADKEPIAEESSTCLQTSMKIGKLIFIVSFDETGLSWVKRGQAIDKAGTIHFKVKA